LAGSTEAGNGILPASTFGLEGTSFPQRGLDEHMMRAYIRNQEEEDKRYDQMKLAME
jgi:hypothetical protein